MNTCSESTVGLAGGVVLAGPLGLQTPKTGSLAGADRHDV